MKTCNYPEKYWLCPHSQRRRFGTWQNSGHPCRFSIGSWIGETKCAYGFMIIPQNRQEAVKK